MLPHRACSIAVFLLVLAAATQAPAQPDFGMEQLVQDGTSALDVGTYSVPCYVDWNNDGDSDLIVGQGDGRVRYYENLGSAASPSFSGYVYVQDGAGDLSVGASGCMGSFPRVAYWNADQGGAMKDLLVGNSTPGNVLFFQNQGTDAAPVFNGSSNVQAGGSDITGDNRRTLCALDWDGDNDLDLIIGGYSGAVSYCENTAGAGADPVLSAPVTWFTLSGYRSSPCVADFDGDAQLDLLVGRTDGKLLYYRRSDVPGPDTSPNFDAPTFATYLGADSNRYDIDLPDSARSRPFACDWTGDGLVDVLVGGADGQVYLYQGVPEPASLGLLALGAAALLRRKR